jgi:hypothetical protein
MSRTTLIKFWIAAAILGALLVGRQAHSAVNVCAVVLKTNDGFVALRSKPSTVAGYRLTKLHAGDYLIVDYHIPSPLGWIAVYPRDVNPNGPASFGWIASDYIQEFRCGAEH